MSCIPPQHVVAILCLEPVLRCRIVVNVTARKQFFFRCSYKSEDRGFDSRWCHWIFTLASPSGCTMALGLTQPLTEMSTRNISWGGGKVKAAGA